MNAGHGGAARNVSSTIDFVAILTLELCQKLALNAGRMTKQMTVSTIETRIRELDRWLEDEAPYARFDQHHLDAGTPVRAYWHLGYAAALRDVLALVNDETEDKRDNASRFPADDPDG